MIPVAPLVGPITSVPTGGSGAQSSGQGRDVAVGNLFFNIAPSDSKPYQRATAQFKKDQLDQGTTVGDQSLTGWWTRGQLSFHHGAGVTYYEVSEGETIINRYNTGAGLNPFTAGAVSLYPDWANAVSDTHASTSYVGTAGNNLVVLDGGALKYGAAGGAGALYSPASAAVQAATTGNGDIYCALTNKTISRIGLAETVTTMYGPQGFESVIDSWDSNTASGAYSLSPTPTISTTQAFEGTHSLKIVWAAAGGTSPGTFVGRNIPGLTTGKAYTMVAKVFVPAGSADVRLSALFAVNGTTVTTKDAWVTTALTFTAYSDNDMFVGVLSPTAAAGNICYVDKVVLYEGTRTDYDTGAVPVDTIYSHSKNFVSIFYAKDRLLAVDEGNSWYQLAPNPSAALPVTVTASDRVFTVGGGRSWSLTDTPGPMLIGSANRIFAVTVDSTGAIPTLSGPVQVADLPPQETIVSLAYHLGFIAIVTTAGCRIGVVSDNGGVTYGPLLFSWTTAPAFTSVGRIGSRVVVTGGHALYDIDLSEQIGSGLEFAYAQMPNPLAGTETNYGATTAPDGRLVCWGDSVTKVQHATNLTTTGSLTTGYHRFGTLEPKRFESVKLRISGLGGTVAVSRIDQNGSEVQLYTLDASVNNSAEVGLGMTETAEAVALKFTLTRKATDATVGPTLLGYQLRALPQPQRQRMIRLPVLIDDVERRQPARAAGHIGSAFARLQALEDLESSGAQVLYTDFRTGESANVYIESVEFQNTTPPSAKSTGFGGTAFITLRKLS